MDPLRDRTNDRLLSWRKHTFPVNGKNRGSAVIGTAPGVEGAHTAFGRNMDELKLGIPDTRLIRFVALVEPDQNVPILREAGGFLIAIPVILITLKIMFRNLDE